jgi:hypothetical protein
MGTDDRNKLKVDSTPNKRIPAFPIVGGVIPTQMLNTSTNPNNNDKSCSGAHSRLSVAIENLKTTNVPRFIF